MQAACHRASAGLGGRRSEMLSAVDLEALLGDIGAAAAPGTFRERRHLQDLEVLVAHVLEPVARIARRDRALLRAELADQNVIWTIEAHASLQHHPEARRRGV